MVAQRVGIDAAGAHAAAGAFAANDEAVDTFLGQMRDEWSSKKAAGPFFVDDDIAGLRLEVLPNLEETRVDLHALAVGGVDSVGVDLLARFRCRVEYRNFQRAAQLKKILGWLDSFIGINAAGTLVFLHQFMRIFGAAFIDQIIEVDGQKGWPLPDVGLAAIRRVGL